MPPAGARASSGRIVRASSRGSHARWHGGGSAGAVRLAYQPGPVGVVSRSGGVIAEIANLLTRSGIGQSTCVSIGGDPIVGSTTLDLLPLYEADPDTAGVVMFCEPGGVMEEHLAAHRATSPPSR